MGEAPLAGMSPHPRPQAASRCQTPIHCHTTGAARMRRRTRSLCTRRRRTQPGAIGEPLHHASCAFPGPIQHAVSGTLAKPNKQGCKTLGSQRRGLATPLAFIGPTGGLDPPAPRLSHWLGGARGLSHDRADLALSNILSQIQNILSILIHANSTIEPRTVK